MVDTSRSANEAWVSRQALQDVYQKLLVMDLEFALDKKVEQELYVLPTPFCSLCNIYLHFDGHLPDEPGLLHLFQKRTFEDE